MNNQTLGIITLLLSFTGYLLAWKAFSINKIQQGILFLIASGIILQIFSSCDLFLHTWDERYHALVAKNLLKHPLIPTLYDTPVLSYQFQEWWANHIWLHKQPVPLWLMAGSMKVFGISEIAIRIPSIIASSLCIFFTYYIGAYLLNRKIAFFAAMLLSFNGLILALTGGRTASDHYDILFLFFIELGVFFTIKFIKTKKNLYNIACGISIGLAILTKWLPALIVIPIWLLLVIDSNQFN